MNVNLSISREVLGQTEDLGTFIMNLKDSYQPYWNTICDFEVWQKKSLAQALSAWQIDSISENSCTIELFYPPIPEEGLLTLTMDEPLKIELGKYGTYTLKLLSVNP